MTEFLGTDGGQIADEVTGLTAAAEQVVAARPELMWDLVRRHHPGRRVEPGMHPGRPGSGSLAGRSPAPGSPGTTGSRMASNMT